MSILDLITNKVGSFIGLNTSLPKAKAGGFDIQEFRSNLSSLNGILPTNLFLVTIHRHMPPQFEKVVTFFTMATDLPGIDIALEDNIVNGTGPVERFPHAAIFNDIKLEFIGDSNGYIMKQMQNWMGNIVQYDKDFGKQFSSPETFHRVNYMDSYISDIVITVYNNTSDKVMEYTLYEAFPYRLNNIPMSWATQNNMMVIDMMFSFKYWTCEHFKVTDRPTPGLTFLQKVIKAATIAETIASLKKPQGVGDAINLVNNANIIGGGLSGFF